MNVVLYVMDALRADHVSTYGYSRPTTPNIDALAKEGITYTKCFSPATWTKPVGASLLTGSYPPTHGVRTREDVFSSGVPRLPKLLAENGYATAGFSTMGNVSKSLGYGRGFSTFEDLYKDPEIIAKRRTTTPEEEELEHEESVQVALPRAEDLTERVINWLESRADSDPLFLFCWSIEPHIPYDPPPEFHNFTNPSYSGPVDGTRECLPSVNKAEDLAQLEALYDGEIRYNDSELGRIMDKFKERGVYDETLFIICGDHGDAFNEHGQLTHGHLPYDELIHVPLVIKPPASVENIPRVIDEISCLIDVMPTILAAGGLDDQPQTIQGRALPPFGKQGTSSPVFSETRSREIYPAFYSVRTERWKYMEVDTPNRTPSMIAETMRQIYRRGLMRDIIANPLYFYRRYKQKEERLLFNLQDDPPEMNNVVQESPEMAEKMSMKLVTWLETCERARKTVSNGEDGPIDEATSEQLRRLGYID